MTQCHHYNKLIMPNRVQQIWHGDSAELAPKIKPGKIQCIITDPPFGVDNLSKQAKTEHGKKYARKIANDESPEIAIATFKRVMTAMMPAMKPESDIYIFTAHQVIKEWLIMCDTFFEPFKFEREAILIWKKDGPGMGDLITWGMGCEFVLYFKRGRRELTDRRRSNVIEISQVNPKKLIHPHEKPVPLLELFVKHSTSPGDTLVDPFGGSGSLARTCQRLDRNCLCIEYDEYNYKEAVKALEGREGAGMDLD